MAKKKEEEKLLLSNEINLDKLKEELTDYVDIQLKKSLKEELEKSNKKLVKEKNKKIFWRNIIIILLFGVIMFLLYLLNSVDYFDKYFLSNNKTSILESNAKADEQNIKPNEPSLEELKKKYSGLIDPIYINESSEYLKDYYDGKLTEELKKYLVLNSIDFTKLPKEEDYNYIEESFFKNEFLKMFDNYKEGAFSYNGNKVRYLSKLELYIPTGFLEKSSSKIKREIIDIKVDKEVVNITTIEGLIKDNKLYNIISLDEVKNYDKDSILKYADNLNELTYVFDNNKFVEIKKGGLNEN